MTVEGLRVVITGASNGIGLATAERFVAEGATVVIGSRSEPDVAGANWIRTDVTSSQSVDDLFAATVTEYGGVDVLINNAGVQVERTVDQTTDDEFDHVMNVNVRGVFNGCRAAVRAMKTTGGGSIINIASTAAQAADHGMAVYNASKGAVVSLTRAVAVDHGSDRIRCNAISPGWIATDMADAAFELAEDPAAARHDAISMHPVGRLGLPADVAGLALWLAGPDAAFVTGSVFTIDGGLTAQSPIVP